VLQNDYSSCAHGGAESDLASKLSLIVDHGRPGSERSEDVRSKTPRPRDHLQGSASWEHRPSLC
jgi:hypothetical protein